MFEQDVKYEAQPNIYTHQPVTPETLQVQNRKLDVQQSTLSDDGSTTSEMSGHDSESIIETVRVFTPRERRNLLKIIFLRCKFGYVVHLF